MSPKLPPIFTRPSPAETEAKLAELEQRAEARGNAVAGQSPDAASSQARSVARLQTRNAARSGTRAAPYVRGDGKATRSTTVHLDVSVHTKLRRAAAERDVNMSAIVDEALREWFAKKP